MLVAVPGAQREFGLGELLAQVSGVAEVGYQLGVDDGGHEARCPLVG